MDAFGCLYLRATLHGIAGHLELEGKDTWRPPRNDGLSKILSCKVYSLDPQLQPLGKFNCLMLDLVHPGRSIGPSFAWLENKDWKLDLQPNFQRVEICPWIPSSPPELEVHGFYREELLYALTHKLIMN